MPLDRRTRATLRRAEFGFLGVMVLTCRHTPRFCGQPRSAGCLGLRYCCRRGLRTSWLIVGIPPSPVSRGARPTVVRAWKPLPYAGGGKGSRGESRAPGATTQRYVFLGEGPDRTLAAR